MSVGSRSESESRPGHTDKPFQLPLSLLPFIPSLFFLAFFHSFSFLPFFLSLSLLPFSLSLPTVYQKQGQERVWPLKSKNEKIEAANRRANRKERNQGTKEGT